VVGSIPNGLTVEQSSAGTAAGHHVGAAPPEGRYVASGCVAAFVTSPVDGFRIVALGALATPSANAPGFVGYFQ
jgi:hypothetical protein